MDWKNWPSQCGHSDSPGIRDKRSVYFMMATASEPSSILLCLGSHAYVPFSPAFWNYSLVPCDWRKQIFLRGPYLSVMVICSKLELAIVVLPRCSITSTWSLKTLWPKTVAFAFGKSLQIANNATFTLKGAPMLPRYTEELSLNSTESSALDPEKEEIKKVQSGD